MVSAGSTDWMRATLFEQRVAHGREPRVMHLNAALEGGYSYPNLRTGRLLQATLTNELHRMLGEHGARERMYVLYDRDPTGVCDLPGLLRSILGEGYQA